MPRSRWVQVRWRTPPWEVAAVAGTSAVDVLAIEPERPAPVGHVVERGRSAAVAIGLGEVAAGGAQEREPAGPRLEVGERARPELAREADQLSLLRRGRLRRLADVEVGQRRAGRLDHGTRGSGAAEQQGDCDGQGRGHRRAGPRRSHRANPRRDPAVRKPLEGFDGPRSTLRAVSIETRERTARANGIEICLRRASATPPASRSC